MTNYKGVQQGPCAVRRSYELAAGEASVVGDFCTFEAATDGEGVENAGAASILLGVFDSAVGASDTDRTVYVRLITPGAFMVATANGNISAGQLVASDASGQAVVYAGKALGVCAGIAMEDAVATESFQFQAGRGLETPQSANSIFERTNICLASPTAVVLPHISITILSFFRA